MFLRNYLPVAVAIVTAAGLSVATARVAVDRLEANARVALTRALSESGSAWARASVDGLQVVLTGTAPDEAARFAALSATGSIVDATRIVDRMDVRPAKNIEAPEFKVEILRNLDGISLIGLIPRGTDRGAILSRIGAIADAPVSDLLEEANFPAPRGWETAVDYAIEALLRIPRSKVSVTANQVMVTGIVDSEQVRRRVETELTGSAPSGVQVSLDIMAPRPVITPFTVRFVIDGESRRFDACAAETQKERDAIIAAARDAGLSGTPICQIGLGSPSVSWADAVSAGIASLSRIGGGTITFSDADVSLVAPYTVEQLVFDREVGTLERALPEEFSLTAVKTQPPVAEGVEEAPEQGIPEFSATLMPEVGVELLGRLPNERSRRTVESSAHAHFGRAATNSATRLDDDLPEAWTLRVLTALDALALLADGEVLVRPDVVSISGHSGREDASAEIARMFAERLRTGAEYQIDVTYVEALDPTADIPTPEECTTRLNGVLAEQKITFEPGSATVDGDGLTTIDRLAEILRDCQHVPMEIAGHTDSQGRESMNQRLSQERADAVLNAIMARRVLTGNLTAKGYGETVPIADNGTDEGREANRRIEFTLVAEEVDSEDSDTGAEVAADSGEEVEDEQN